MAKLPDSHEVALLLDKGVLTKDEAREILFSLETQEDRDRESLQSEIKFLRELVQRLASTPTQIIQTIKAVEKPYTNTPWYPPYVTWCANTSEWSTGDILTSTSGIMSYSTDAVNTMYAGGSGGGAYMVSSTNEPDFTSVKTF